MISRSFSALFAIFLVSSILTTTHGHKPGEHAHHRKLVRVNNKTSGTSNNLVNDDVAARNNENKYWVKDVYTSSKFFDEFEFEHFDDPTHGRVNYTDINTAIQQNLAVATGGSFILRTDYKSVLDPNGPGRNSVRIRSKKAYTTHVAVFDVRHVPQGCGTWPAIWEVGPGWPNGGELDIVEGTNDEGTNAATLHTSPGCSMPATRDAQRGTRVFENCDATVNSNIGCPVQFPQADSYGPAFNRAGGGYYAVERTTKFIKVWFWSRNDPSVPRQIREGKDYVKPDEWGQPTAFFPDTQCNLSRHFNEHWIVINLTLCGDWAGTTFGQAGCPGSCVDHVNNNPAAFQEAYFDIGAVRVYEK